jgi:hypothetical protein
MTFGTISLLAPTLTLVFMGTSFLLAIVAHAMRLELDPIETPFSAYLSGASRGVGLACYASLVMGITMFAFAFATRAGFGAWSSIILMLYAVSVVCIAIAAVTARADLAMANTDNRWTRGWHRWSAFTAFLSAIAAIAIQTWLWREQEFLKTAWPLIACLAMALIVLFVLLSFAPPRFKGAVQKLLILGVMAWFSFVALLMQI